MKLLVIGFGQCGSRIADEFARLGKRARFRRGLNIIAGTVAVNTDVVDLTNPSHMKADYRHRILIGSRLTGGHGVGKINEVGAEAARLDRDKILNAVRSSERFYEADAFMLIASSAGGTGSGSIPVMTQAIKERYWDKPVYNLIVLPFQHEEEAEERTIYNSATCLKAASSVADAVFLVDNQRYLEEDDSIANNMSAINELMVEPFYNLLCAGEEKKSKHVGTRLLDTGDIIQTLSGWTVIGHGTTHLSVFRFPFGQHNYRKKSIENRRGIQAMDSAISQLSLTCNPQDAGRGLYLLSAPKVEMSMGLVKELGDYLGCLASEAVIRYGDYPRERTELDVTVVLSELKRVGKVKHYYDVLPTVIKDKEKRHEDREAALKELLDAANPVPEIL